MTAIETRSQSASPGNLVVLEIDMTPLGLVDTLNFVKRGANGTGTVSFGGVVYEQIDVVASGFKWDGNGTFPTPKLSVSVVNGILTPFLVQYDFLVGATVTVITYDVYLDGGAEADPDGITARDIHNRATYRSQQHFHRMEA